MFLIAALAIAIAAPLVRGKAVATCEIGQKTFSVFENQCGCRSTVGLDIKSIVKADNVEKIECFSKCSCTGEVLVTVTEPKKIFDKVQRFDSCRIYPKTVTEPKPLPGQCDNKKNATTPAYNLTETRYAVLFEEKNFKGIKHWIDGKYGECRGLSGVPVQSIRGVMNVGGDPETNAIRDDKIDDKVTFVFFSDYNCPAGKAIGGVVGSSGDLKELSSAKPLSVQIVATGTSEDKWGLRANSINNSGAKLTAGAFVMTVLAMLM